MRLGFAVAAAAALLPFASAVAAPDVTTYYAGGGGPTATITADNQKVTSIDKSIKTTSYYCDKSGAYTPPHQTKVWTVYEPTWITYEVPLATAYIYPYKEAICGTCTKNVEVIVYIDIDIITYSGQIWKVIDGRTVTEIKTVTATPSYVSNYLPPSTTTPINYAAKTHTVKVGGLNGTTPILRYNPEYVADVKVGDVVLFDILANNHTVTESTFDAPCVPKYGGVDSGFRPNMQNVPGLMTFPVTVTDDKPRWFYCAQPGNGKPHCQAGMVFAINAPKTGNTLEAFKKLAAAVPVSSAPSKTTSGYTSPTGGAAATYTVKVGGLDGTTPILKYNPEYVDVKVGDVVLFDILANNHTVTESTFDAPCVPKYGGVDSGFRPNMQNVPGLMTFPVTVTDDKPRWFYCAQPGNGKPHCQAGMVFAINAPKTGNTLEAFKKLAAAVPVSSAPSKTTSVYPSPTGGAAAATHTVKVGGLNGTTPILKYNPEYVADVKVGDVVLFDILANNHTVTESTFDAPCVPKYGGVDSGFRPNMQNVPGLMTFPVTVTDDKPRWFYCAQPGNGKPHCQAGMVFAINAPKTGNKTLEAFKKLAAAVPVSGVPSPTAPTAYGPAVTHFVSVGGLLGNVTVLKYNPESVKANIGDVVRFDILAANHTVTESSFDAPCVPNGGVDSGFRPNKENIPGAQLFTVNVHDDKPKWFYCAQPGNGKPHCQAGMVFAINPPASGNTLEAFKAKAAKVPIKYVK